MEAKRQKYDTDGVMLNVFHHLLRDFRSVLADNDYHRDAEVALKRGVPEFRALSWPGRSQVTPHLFKMEVQLENLFKRYKFKRDTYTNAQLEEITFSKFMDHQVHLARHCWKSPKQSTYVVLQKARGIVAEILADFDPHTAFQFSRFSVKATVGNAASDAYIDHKLADPISGSPDHVKWFKSHLRGNGYLASVIEKCRSEQLLQPSYNPCESLPLVDVPKSWKSHRLISPNTLIGSYYTYGLGSLLVSALKQVGLPIAKLQARHKRLAKQASVNRKLVTADLSSASESFLWQLIARLMPRKWLRALNFGRLRYYTRKGKKYYYHSFMAMGIGFTFPLQTLLFYAIVKAICTLSEVDGTVSVYGDDLIYPRHVHNRVVAVLTDLGMVLNEDKTFVHTHFRESCGGDYFHGVDVRPYNPEGGHQELYSRKYTAFIYQVINGLLQRWCVEEIPQTLTWLLSEINRVGHKIYRVPPSFPDTSGMRCVDPDFCLPNLTFARVECGFRDGSRHYKIPHLLQTVRNRYVSFQDVYLYEWLRGRDAGTAYDAPLEAAPSVFEWLQLMHNRRELAKWFQEPSFQLLWQRAPVQPKNYRSRLNGSRLKRLLAMTPCTSTNPKISTTVTGPISDWI